MDSVPNTSQYNMSGNQPHDGYEVPISGLSNIHTDIEGIPSSPAQGTDDDTDFTLDHDYDDIDEHEYEEFDFTQA